MNSAQRANHQQLRDDEIKKLENLIQPEITKLTKQKQGIVQLIQKDPIEYQLKNFEVKINIKIKHKKTPNYVELKQTKMEIAQEPAGIWSQLGQAFDEMVTSFNGPYEFAGYVNCAPYFKQERIMTKNMFIWYDSRRCWIIGNEQHFSRRNGSGNLRLLTEELDIAKLDPWGWDESDDQGRWSKEATVLLTPQESAAAVLWNEFERGFRGE